MKIIPQYLKEHQNQVYYGERGVDDGTRSKFAFSFSSLEEEEESDEESGMDWDDLEKEAKIGEYVCQKGGGGSVSGRRVSGQDGCLQCVYQIFPPIKKFSFSFRYTVLTTPLSLPLVTSGQRVREVRG